MKFRFNWASYIFICYSGHPHLDWGFALLMLVRPLPYPCRQTLSACLSLFTCLSPRSPHVHSFHTPSLCSTHLQDSCQLHFFHAHHLALWRPFSQLLQRPLPTTSSYGTVCRICNPRIQTTPPSTQYKILWKGRKCGQITDEKANPERHVTAQGSRMSHKKGK